jgi:hypothetical protein
MGIEPTSEAWEASILPLYDARSTYPGRSIIHNLANASFCNSQLASPKDFHPGSHINDC